MKLLFFDATLRDGSHAVAHQIETKDIEAYCEGVDSAGLHTVIVGHGNGLGASSFQVGFSLNKDEDMLKAAKLKKTRLGVYMIPGFGTIHDNLAPALDLGVKVVKIGCHCTEADTTVQHLDFAGCSGAEPYGVLMMSHMATPLQLLEQAGIMADSGAKGVILMDSAGFMLPEDVRARISCLAEGLNIRVGFHAHDNLGLAVANTLEAIDSGATIVDGTLRGFGAGAGNAPLEVIAGILAKKDIETGLDFYKLLDVCDMVVLPRLQKKPREISSLSLVSGLAGVFSAFAKHVTLAGERFKVDPRDILWELGRRKVVGGQEDIIVDVAMNLAQQTKEDESSYLIESLL